MKQCTNSILMISPVGFRYNEQTATNNYYQHVLENLSPEQVQVNALHEFDNFVAVLKSAGLNVIVFEDTKMPSTPDSIFPNNWISFHADGRVVLYPMFAKNRRVERRADILESLVNDYGFLVKEIVDYSTIENKDVYLEGTGSMVLDRTNKLCYAAKSERTHRVALDQFCKEFEYQPVSFTAYQTVEGERVPMYHTNVMMCVSDLFAVVCLDAIDNLEERIALTESLQETGKNIIEISEKQTSRFAGNMLQVNGESPCVVMSTSAFQSLSEMQISKIEKHGRILHSSLDTIEACGGGSARCMMAEVFLPTA
jgi:hypothetical protein